MKTKIIPEIAKIEVSENKILLSLSDYSLDSSVIGVLPIATEIFKNNVALTGEKRIVYIPAQLEVEEYKIKVTTEQIEVYALTARGLMYGLFTLSELALINDDILSECEIHDAPVLKTRALSDDVSRGQFSTMENFFAIIRRLARYKYNTYMPYIEDVFKFECCEAWGRYSGALSKNEWGVIIAYAKKYQLEVRPIINLLGHQDKSCHIKELIPLMIKHEDNAGNTIISSVFDPQTPEVRTLIVKILKEIVDCFGEGVIHCGGDEPTALTEVYGKETGGQLFIEHYTFISNELAKLNCTMMMYADFFAPPWGDYAVPVDRARELPSSTEFVFWDYAVRESYPFVDALHRQKLNLLLSPGTWTWKRFSCDIKTCYDNTKGLLNADQGRANGMIMSSWGDGGDSLRENIWPGVIIGANFCWAPQSEYLYEDIFALYHKSYFGFEVEEALLLEPVYQHDTIIKREDYEQLEAEFFRSPFEPKPFIDIESIGILQAAMKKAKADLDSLTPLRNRHTFNALYLTVARALFTANRIAQLPSKIPNNIEDNYPYAEKAILLSGEITAVKELHKKLWHDCNADSDWRICECRYDDTIAELLKFARHCKLRIMHERKVW